MTCEKVTRLRALLRDAIVMPGAHAESAHLLPKQQTSTQHLSGITNRHARAKLIRNIQRIGQYYGWGLEIQHLLDLDNIPCLQAMSDVQLQRAHDHMTRLETCLHDGCDLPNCPPAR